MMMVLFFRGGLSFSFEDSLSCRMATSATGSEPFSTNSSAGGGGVDTSPKVRNSACGPWSTADALCGHVTRTDMCTQGLCMSVCVSCTPIELGKNQPEQVNKQKTSKLGGDFELREASG